MERDYLVVAGVRTSLDSHLAVKKLIQQIQSPYALGLNTVRNKQDLVNEEDKIKELVQISELNDSVDKIKAQRQNIQNLINCLKNTNQKLGLSQAENKRLREDVNQLHKVKLKYDMLLPQHQALLLKFNSLKQQKQYYEKKLNDMHDQGFQDQILQLKTQNAQLRNRIDILLVDNEKLQRTVHFLKIQNVDHQTSFNNSLASFKIQLNALLLQRQKLQKQNQILRERVAILSDGGSTQGNQINLLKKQLEKSKQAYQKLKNIYDQRQQMILTLEEALNKAKVDHHKQYTQIVSQIQRIVIQLNKSRAQVQDLKLQNLDKQTKIQALDEDNKCLRRQIDDLNALLSTQLQHYQAEKSSGEGILKALKAQIEALKAKLNKINEWRIVDRQNRFDIQTLRYNAKCQKQKQIRRIDQLMNSINICGSEKKRF